MALGLLVLVAALAADAILQYRKVGNVDYWSRATGWAAAGQLQRCQAGAALDSLPPGGTVPEEIALETTHEPGQGQWQGFERVTVTAGVVVSGCGTVQAQVSGYVPVEGQP